MVSQSKGATHLVDGNLSAKFSSLLHCYYHVLSQTRPRLSSSIKDIYDSIVVFMGLYITTLFTVGISYHFKLLALTQRSSIPWQPREAAHTMSTTATGTDQGMAGASLANRGVLEEAELLEEAALVGLL